jgi:hypothetical protein
MGVFGSGRAVRWTKDRINLLTTAEVRQLRANAERLRNAEVAALCDQVLGERPRGGARQPKQAAR